MLERFQRLYGVKRLSAEVWEQWRNGSSTWRRATPRCLSSPSSALHEQAGPGPPRPARCWTGPPSTRRQDGAALYASTLDGRHEHDSHADLCLRAGYLALLAICGYFQIPFNAAPQRGDPISITRSEFDSACERLQASGLPIRADREACWEDFSGWRVNFDEPLLILAGLISAPYALVVRPRQPAPSQLVSRAAPPLTLGSPAPVGGGRPISATRLDCYITDFGLRKRG